MDLKTLMHDEINKYYDEIVKVRRELHQVPEIGFDLKETLKIIMNKLDEHKIPYEKCGKCGLKVVIKGGHEGTTTLIRGDMDALPMAEEATVDFKSTNGNMHACGHDLHSSSLLGSTIVLNNLKEHIKGTVICMFQPGEETLNGSIDMIENGILEGVDEALATHVFTSVPNTKPGDIIISEPGAMLAGSDLWTLNIQGKSSHGAQPENGVSTITIMSEIFSAWKNISAREVNTFEPFILTTGIFKAGTAKNILPDTGVMEGTLRTFSKENREYVLTRMEEIANKIAEVYGGSIELIIDNSVPVTVNDANVVEALKTRINKLVDSEMTIGYNESQGEPLLGSEDFSLVLENIPGVFVAISGGECDYPLHHPKVEFNEEELRGAMITYSAFVLGK